MLVKLKKINKDNYTIAWLETLLVSSFFFALKKMLVKLKKNKQKIITRFFTHLFLLDLLLEKTQPPPASSALPGGISSIVIFTYHFHSISASSIVRSDSTGTASSSSLDDKYRPSNADSKVWDPIQLRRTQAGVSFSMVLLFQGNSSRSNEYSALPGKFECRWA